MTEAASAPSADSFPANIQSAMRSAGSAATCVPVRLGGSEWESALFVQVAGEECENDRALLERVDAPTPAGLDMELIAHSTAAVIVLRLEVLTVPDDPLRYEILLTPGAVDTHYQSVKLLARQERLCWFFGDGDYRIIQAQEQEISAEQHAHFEKLCRDAFAHDSLLRMTQTYDVAAALTEVLSHYSPKEPHARPAGQTTH